jgi:hypothetical protein
MFASSLALVLSIACPHTQAPEPKASNLKKWLAYIRPDKQEESYRDIGWRNELWPAVLEARKLGRPILLWTMNGHPLGST